MKFDLSNFEIKKYMLRCIELAKKSHNEEVRKPYVGTIILSSEGKVIGEGYKSLVDHTKLLVHSERMALNNVGTNAKGSCLITTLEPCVRMKKNQIFDSCSKLIVENKIEIVIVGLSDSSEHMYGGRGIGYLRRKGVNVKIYHGLSKVIAEELMPRSTSLSYDYQKISY